MTPFQQFTILDKTVEKLDIHSIDTHRKTESVGGEVYFDHVCKEKEKYAHISHVSQLDLSKIAVTRFAEHFTFPTKNTI